MSVLLIILIVLLILAIFGGALGSGHFGWSPLGIILLIFLILLLTGNLKGLHI